MMHTKFEDIIDIRTTKLQVQSYRNGILPSNIRQVPGSRWRWRPSDQRAQCWAAARRCSAVGCWHGGSGRRRNLERTLHWRWRWPLQRSCKAERHCPLRTTTGLMTRRKCWTAAVWKESLNFTPVEEAENNIVFPFPVFVPVCTHHNLIYVYNKSPWSYFNVTV